MFWWGNGTRYWVWPAANFSHPRGYVGRSSLKSEIPVCGGVGAFIRVIVCQLVVFVFVFTLFATVITAGREDLLFAYWAIISLSNLFISTSSRSYLPFAPKGISWPFPLPLTTRFRALLDPAVGKYMDLPSKMHCHKHGRTGAHKLIPRFLHERTVVRCGNKCKIAALDQF
jgi:hypothetical protein